ncbi:MAG: VCBS repeat-containing protein [Gemmatimonadota bacterium]
MKLLPLSLVVVACASATVPDGGAAEADFEDVSSARLEVPAGHPAMDARPADVDDDGDLDLFLAGEFAPNLLLINEGGRLVHDPNRLPATGRDSEDIATADFDGDGDLDVLFVSEDDQVNELFLNDGSGSFTLAPSFPVTGTSNAVLASDLTGDGVADVLIGNAGQNVFLRGDGTGGFVDETDDRLPADLRVTQDLELGDVDGDGDVDLFVANENGSRLLINDGTGRWEDETDARLPAVTANRETREGDFGDIDGDGDLDLMLANVIFSNPSGNAGNLVLRNDGDGVFEDVTASALPSASEQSVDVDLTDLDGDGDLDLLVGNFLSQDRAYRNDGNGTFTAEPPLLPSLPSRDGLDFEVADFDQDGRPEIYVANRGQADRLFAPGS